MSAVDVVLQVFRSVEERNPQLAAELYHDDLEFHWPRPLPYAGMPRPSARRRRQVQKTILHPSAAAWAWV